jgi:hypothetical protein
MSDLSDRVGTDSVLSSARVEWDATLTARREAMLGVVVGLVLWVIGLVQSPVPGVNESHWLGKARAAWDASYCPGDFFYASTSAHFVFLTLMGPLTLVAPLPVVAVIGRLVASLVVGIALTRLTRRVVPGMWPAAILLFLMYQMMGNLSGEWLVGGVEAKQFGYAALMMAIVDLGASRWVRAAAWLGGAIAFHPVIGGWGAVAITAALGMRRPVGVPWGRAVLVAAACAAPGLVPAVSMLRESPSPAIAQAAALEQVYGRLRHHLDPTDFSGTEIVWYAILSSAWLLSIRDRGTTEALGDTGWWLRQVVNLSAVFAGVGFVVGFGAAGLDGRLDLADGAGAGPLGPWSIRAASLLKFYPFRLFDLLLPLGVACVVGLAFPIATTARTAIVAIVTFSVCMSLVTTSPLLGEVSDSKLTPQLWADFRDAAGWIRTATPNESLVVTPTFSRDFKWYAERAEYVCHKDCPQDAAGVVEWRRRMNYWKTWRQTAFATAGAGDPITPGELAGLARDTRATHLLIHAAVTVEAEPVFRNATFAVYELPPPNAAAPAAD